MKNKIIARGDIYWAYLSAEAHSRVIKELRPVVVVSNDQNNQYSPVIVVVPLTTQKKKWLPVHVELSGFGLKKDSIAVVEQVRSLDYCSLGKKIGSLAGSEKMNELDRALKTHLNVA